jgi:phage major head subunit gpT-like protein
MGVLNNAEMRAVARNTRGIFYDSLKSAPGLPFLASIFFIIQSNAITEVFTFLRGIPKMRQWVGDRRISGLSAASFSIEKKDWEATISITRDDLQFDRLNLIRPNIQALGGSFPRHYVDFLVDLLTNGFTRLAYDGQYFYDVDHDFGDGTTYANKTTGQFNAARWVIAELAPAGMTDPESKEFLEIYWTDIYYGPQDQSAVDAVFNNPMVAVGGIALPNIHFGKIPKERQHMIRAFGTGRKWFLTDESKPVKPLILQIVKGVSFEAFDDPHDWNMFNRKEPIYGIESQDNAGYGLWELSYGSDGTIA